MLVPSRIAAGLGGFLSDQLKSMMSSAGPCLKVAPVAARLDGAFDLLLGFDNHDSFSLSYSSVSKASSNSIWRCRSWSTSVLSKKKLYGERIERKFGNATFRLLLEFALRAGLR